MKRGLFSVTYADLSLAFSQTFSAVDATCITTMYRLSYSLLWLVRQNIVSAYTHSRHRCVRIIALAVDSMLTPRRIVEKYIYWHQVTNERINQRGICHTLSSNESEPE